jgi:tetratricopeptide (TPR) repeat protein
MRAFSIGYMAGNYLKAASEAKEGSENLKFIVEKNSKYYDAYLGLGVYNYALSFIPRKLQWLTSMLGFSGDRDEGKRMLMLASDNGTYTSSEAKMYLILLLWREENYPLAENYMSQLNGKYPQSPAVWMVQGLLYSQQDKMSDAIAAYEKALEYNKGKDSEIIFRTAYGSLGTAYFRTNNFEMASEYGKKYMSYTTKDDFINNRLHSIGVSLELLGRRSEAMSYYNQARTDIREENQWEKFWLRKLRYRQSNPVSQIDSLLIIADNNRAVGKLEESISEYNKLYETFYQSSNDDIKVQINHGFAQVQFRKKDYNKAIEIFTRNLTLSPAEEKWLVPEAYFQIGRCYMRLGDKNKAVEFFDKAEAIDYEYDFKDALDNKIKNELSRKQNQ